MLLERNCKNVPTWELMRASVLKQAVLNKPRLIHRSETNDGNVTLTNQLWNLCQIEISRHDWQTGLSWSFCWCLFNFWIINGWKILEETSENLWSSSSVSSDSVKVYYNDSDLPKQRKFWLEIFIFYHTSIVLNLLFVSENIYRVVFCRK